MTSITQWSPACRKVESAGLGHRCRVAIAGHVDQGDIAPTVLRYAGLEVIAVLIHRGVLIAAALRDFSFVERRTSAALVDACRVVEAILCDGGVYLVPALHD